MPRYEEKLNEFARGKKLLRLSRPVRDRADAYCDACGSTQPRTLYGVKDTASQRYYFVGDTCLKELAKRGYVLRRYGRESSKEAYQEEAQRRGEERKNEPTGPGADDAGGIDRTRERGEARSWGLEGLGIVPAVFAVLDTDSCRVLVTVVSSKGDAFGWGYAEESRFEEAWRRTEDGVLLFEKVDVERPDAMGRCVAKAWDTARLQLLGPGQLLYQEQDSNDEHVRSLGLWLLDQIGLLSRVKPSSWMTATSGNGHG